MATTSAVRPSDPKSDKPHKKGQLTARGELVVRAGPRKTKDRRDPEGTEIMKMVSLRMPPELVERLKAEAKKRDWGYQALARQVLAEFLFKMGKTK